MPYPGTCRVNPTRRVPDSPSVTPTSGRRVAFPAHAGIAQTVIPVQAPRGDDGNLPIPLPPGNPQELVPLLRVEVWHGLPRIGQRLEATRVMAVQGVPGVVGGGFVGLAAAWYLGQAM